MAIDDNLDKPGYEVQVRFNPEVFNPAQELELVVKVVPIGQYSDKTYSFLETFELNIGVNFMLDGFFGKMPVLGDPCAKPYVCAVNFPYKGHQMERTIPILAGARVAGTEYREMHYFNNSLKRFIEGHIEQGKDGCYLRRPGDGGDFFSVAMLIP